LNYHTAEQLRTRRRPARTVYALTVTEVVGCGGPLPCGGQHGCHAVHNLRIALVHQHSEHQVLQGGVELYSLRVHDRLELVGRDVCFQQGDDELFVIGQMTVQYGGQAVCGTDQRVTGTDMVTVTIDIDDVAIY
jgi:hypothetical protein